MPGSGASDATDSLCGKRRRRMGSLGQASAGWQKDRTGCSPGSADSFPAQFRDGIKTERCFSFRSVPEQ